MASTTLVQVPASDLIEDFDIYPREQVDSSNTSRLAEVLRSRDDVTLRIVADRKSKRIVDGFHSRRAYICVFGDDAQVPVEWREYADEQELYLDAIRLNAAHGKPITGVGLTHALLRGVDKGIGEMALAEVFGIRPGKVEEIVKIRMGTVTVRSARGKSVRPRHVAMKNSVRHLWGSNPKFTPEQERVHDSLPGVSQWFMLKQVADLVESGLIDKSDARVVEQLSRLRRLLE